MQEANSQEIDSMRIQEQLRFNLSSVNDWLKFAEAKNAALVAANIGAAFGAFKLAATPMLHPLVFHYALFAGGLLLLGTGVSLASFIAQLEMPRLAELHDEEPEDSILFYGHIADCEPESYLRELYVRNGLRFAEASSLEEDYAKQIITNSQIAVRKFNWFNFAVYLTITALATPIFTTLLVLMLRVRATREHDN